jgi:ADP-ribose pyrophosphatase YjhB (NUDIX family)
MELCVVWKPHVTVAAVIEQNQHFLLVEEQTSQGVAFNQPAGHLEANENLVSAIIREVQEETAWVFEPEYLIGVQLWRRSSDFPTFLRFCFTGQVHSHNPTQILDDGIINTHWLSRDEISQKNLRSPLVLESIDEFLRGERYPLSMLKSFIDLS